MILEEAGVNKRTVAALAAKKIYTVNDVIRCFPKKYLDYRNILPIEKAKGEDCAVAGYLQNVKISGKKNQKIIEMDVIESSSGQLMKVRYFHMSQLYNYIKSLCNTEIVLCGKVDPYGNMTNPTKVTLKDEFKGRIVPVYKKMKGISLEMLTGLIHQFLKNVKEPLEHEIIEKARLMDYKQALCVIHNPKDMESLRLARKRIAFNDLLYFSMKTREQSKTKDSPYHIRHTEKTLALLEKLPFGLTHDQAMAMNCIRKEMAEGRLNGLIQGDVGCGKTVIAYLSMHLCYENEYQAAMMAPTEILAKQHYEEFCRLFPDFAGRSVLLTGSLKIAERKEVLARIVIGDAMFIFGTQSLLSDEVMFYKMGLAITDEEHRFGVEQRDNLAKKADEGVHVLTMSATPIPRSVAEALYGEDKLFIEIKTLPAGRVPVQTAVNNSQKVIYEFAEKQLKLGHQIYVVCPLVNEAEEGSTMEELDSVDVIYENYRMYFETLGYKTVALYGKQNKKVKEEAIHAFETGSAQILVSTTVVEVGVNVPNATLIILHNAERFGLATMHQLRGRVGRGSAKGYCILKSDDKENERLQAMVQTTDGFEIAEMDLKQRGPGNLMGVEQSGNDYFMDLLMRLPNMYKSAKKYASYMKKNALGGDLCKVYEESIDAKAQNNVRKMAG